MKSRIAIKTNENLILQDQVTRLTREIERVCFYFKIHDQSSDVISMSSTQLDK